MTQEQEADDHSQPDAAPSDRPGVVRQPTHPRPGQVQLPMAGNAPAARTGRGVRQSPRRVPAALGDRCVRLLTWLAPHPRRKPANTRSGMPMDARNVPAATPTPAQLHPSTGVVLLAERRAERLRRSARIFDRFGTETTIPDRAAELTAGPSGTPRRWNGSHWLALVPGSSAPLAPAPTRMTPSVS